MDKQQANKAKTRLSKAMRHLLQHQPRAKRTVSHKMTRPMPILILSKILQAWRVLPSSNHQEWLEAVSAAQHVAIAVKVKASVIHVRVNATHAVIR